MTEACQVFDRSVQHFVLIPDPGGFLCPARNPAGALFSEEYTFYLTVNDLGRLWVNETLIIDAWTSDATGKTHSGKIRLVAGEKVPIRIDFAEKTKDAKVKLEWESMSNPKEVIPRYQLYTAGTNAVSGITNSPIIHIYPNPATNQVTLESYNQFISTITIFDMYGRTVFISEGPLTNNRTIDISKLPNGIYLIEAVFDNYTSMKRFIKN